MDQKSYSSSDEIAWCPGCGDFGILSAVKKALVQIGKQPREVLLVSGIGQAAKLPHYVRANCFNGLHGRALPAAAGAKIANNDLTVIVTTGEGDCYGEGGNHFIHNIRRNVDMTVVVHDNQVYGLTKGQASPTTEFGRPTKVQPGGVILDPLRPLELAIAMGCGFVARGFSGDIDHLASLIVKGVAYKGFALIDVLQPCVSFNRTNTAAWYRERVYDVSAQPGYNASDKAAAYEKAEEWGERIPTGLIYYREKKSYGENSGLSAMPPLAGLDITGIDLAAALDEYR